MKILVILDAFTDNLGDTAIAFCTKNMLLHRFPNAEVCFQSYRGKYSRPVRMNGKVKKYTRGILRHLKKIVPEKFIRRAHWYWQNRDEIRHKHRNTTYDLVAIGGGPLIDAYWMYPFAFWVWASKYHAFSTNRVIMLGTGYGFNLSQFDKRLVSNALKNVKKAYLRDESSMVRFQQDFQYSSELMYDVAFTISKFISANPRLNQVTFFPLWFDAVRKEYTYEAYFSHWLESAKDSYSKGYKIVLSTTETSQDLNILKHLEAELIVSNIPIEVIIPNNLNELVATISASSAVFSGRMHALIIGYSYGCECIAFPDTLKLTNFRTEILIPKTPLSSIIDNIFQTFDTL